MQTPPALSHKDTSFDSCARIHEQAKKWGIKQWAALH